MWLAERTTIVVNIMAQLWTSLCVALVGSKIKLWPCLQPQADHITLYQLIVYYNDTIMGDNGDHILAVIFSVDFGKYHTEALRCHYYDRKTHVNWVNFFCDLQSCLNCVGQSWFLLRALLCTTNLKGKHSLRFIRDDYCPSHPRVT